MTQALENHNKEVKQKKARIAELEKSIRKNEARLPELQEEYKTSVVNDAENIDDLFHEMESLEKKLKADKHKLETLKTVTDSHLRESALNVIKGFNNDVELPTLAKAKEIMDQIEKAKKAYVKSISELYKEGIELNREYLEQAAEYMDLIYENEFSRQEVGGNLYNDLDYADQRKKPFIANHEITKQYIHKEMNK